MSKLSNDCHSENGLTVIVKAKVLVNAYVHMVTVKSKVKVVVIIKVKA